MKKLKRLISGMIFLCMFITLISKSTFADGTLCKIIFYDGIHYIEDPKNTQEDIVVYCMNNELNWPHITENGQQIPDYIYGYLDSKDIQNYDEMIKKLKKILFMGYPYNGMRLYEIIEDKDGYIPSEEEFNDMLKPDPILVEAFPELGHHKFTIDNFSENKDVLLKFIYDVLMTKETNINSSLTKPDIMVNPFYKAVICLINFDNPLEAFAYMYSDSYYVTEEEAYNNTQSAIWKLMYDYGVPSNNLNDISNYKLGEVFMQYANSDFIILAEEPLSNKIEVKSDFKFTQGSDGKWYSGNFRIEEPDEYNGMYILDLPDGISLMNGSVDNIYGNQDYVFVSDHMPESDEEFRIWSNIMWAKEPSQYSPLKDIEYKGKKYQKMTGLYTNRTHLWTEFTYGDVSSGDLKVTNKVSGNAADKTKEFTYTVILSDKTINGKYGEMEFKNGVSIFKLRDNESKEAIGLPANVEYEIIESDNEEYQVTSSNSTGKIEANQIITVEFTNIKNLKPTQIPDLDPMPIPDEEANIVDTNKPINPSTIPNKEEINQNTIDKLPNTGRSNFILIGILMILSGVAIVKNKK
ncbi:LPXTG cell wall anchor domain-containing protein [Clostridium sp. K04]|uniref:LPXTG cell wall anchor domain-containing protein n=6 Tax=Clostridium TaxID=1485 RepID=UPI001C8B7E49|nr:LPXTG cell wall anchor domain-containing protein [Clostridium sp. K04]MBX9185686.1 LPXTG cell wall anchor domain-containing protein [Clostridium sp. K04]